MGYLLNPKSIDPIIALLLPISLTTCGLPIPKVSETNWFQYLINSLPFYHYSKFVVLVSGINIENRGLFGRIISKLKTQEMGIQDNLITHVLYLSIFGLIFYLVSVWAYKRDQSLS